MQALLALKILLQISGQLENELLLLDFMNFTTSKIKASRRAECLAPSCAHIHDLARSTEGLEISFRSLAAAAQSGFEAIDIRDDQEVAASPAAARHIPMKSLLANPQQLPGGRPILLICATGKRSLATADALRKLGISARSLSGGLKNLEH
jgi:rhodanese-related sulfurtransferase